MRLPGLDFARAWLMILGVWYHSALIYAPPVKMSWRVASPQTSAALCLLSDAIHEFRMPAFYLLAGYFLAGMLQRRGARSTLLNRWTRLGIPMLVTGFTLNTAMNLLSTQWRFHLNGWADLPVYVWRGEWLGHLWFIGNLLVYVVIGAALDTPLRRLTARAAQWPGVPLALCAAAALATTALGLVGARVSDHAWLFVTPESLLTHLPVFMLGLVLGQQPALLRGMTTPGHTVLLAVLAGVATGLSLRLDLAQRSFTADQAIQAFRHLVLALVILSVCLRVQRLPRVLVLLVGASYTIYLLHQPLVVALYRLLEPVGLSPWPGFILISTVTLVLSAAFHLAVVERHAWAGWLFNGQAAPAPASGQRLGKVPTTP